MDDLEYYYDTGELCILETYQRIQYVKRYISAAPLPNAKLELPKGLFILFSTLFHMSSGSYFTTWGRGDYNVHALKFRLNKA